MRGKADVVLNRIDRIGITPAYAGKSAFNFRIMFRHEDHPRLCGEKPSFDCFWFCCIRITPAYAGKSKSFRGHRSATKDHPRLCGEKIFYFSICGGGTGSPPPMRGKDTLRTCDCTAIGITPAYAGKSLTVTVKSHRVWDHPRLCGEKPVDHGDSVHSRGSPPPMRGKDSRRKIRTRPKRITPAYAGKSKKGLSKRQRN